MTSELYVRGLAIGFAIAAALGPVGLLVIRRTIERGWRFGFLSGLGVAAADATYGAVAAFGLTAITELLVGIDRPLGIVGGLVLLALAGRSLRDALRPANPATAARETPDARAAGSALRGLVPMYLLTLTNPATILSFAALFASIGAGTGGVDGAAAVVLGVLSGSAAWWALLTGLVSAIRARLTPAIVRALNIASAVIIGAFGLVALVLGISG